MQDGHDLVGLYAEDLRNDPVELVIENGSLQNGWAEGNVHLDGGVTQYLRGEKEVDTVRVTGVAGVEKAYPHKTLDFQLLQSVSGIKKTGHFRHAVVS